MTDATTPHCLPLVFSLAAAPPCPSSADTPAAISAIALEADAASLVTLPFVELMNGVPAYAEIALKWTLNAISTAAQIAKVRT